jgi:hypothetical protein
MEISRHARNNMRLYNISERDILNAIDSPDVSGRERDKVVAVKKFQDKFSGFPLKVVYEKKGNELSIITAYPIKSLHSALVEEARWCYRDG